MKYLGYPLLALLISTAAAAETFDATADGGFPCDSFSGSFSLEGTHFTGRLNSPSASSFWFDTHLKKGVFDTVGSGMGGAIRIRGTIVAATIALFASDWDCSGNLFLKAQGDATGCRYPAQKGQSGPTC